MPGYQAATYQSFGRSEYLRSTVGLVFESYTLAASTVLVDASVDANRVLQSGTVLALITSGPNANKVGPLEFDATDGREDVANIVGICDSFFPYQLGKVANPSDREVAVLKHGRVDSRYCYEYVTGETHSPGTRGLTSPTKAALATRGADLDLMVL